MPNKRQDDEGPAKDDPKSYYEMPVRLPDITTKRIITTVAIAAGFTGLSVNAAQETGQPAPAQPAAEIANNPKVPRNVGSDSSIDTWKSQLPGLMQPPQS